MFFEDKRFIVFALDTSYNHIDSKSNNLTPEYPFKIARLLGFHFSPLLLFPGTAGCQCNEFVWKAVTGVLILVIILLIIVIIWQHKRGNIKTFPFS